MAAGKITKTKYGQFCCKCSCGQGIHATYIFSYGYIVSCKACGRTYRGGFWFRTVLYGLFIDYENHTLFRKRCNRFCRWVFLLT